MKLKTKADYLLARDEVKAMVHHLDPYCLLEDCPEDEYDMEIAKILSGIRNWSSPLDIAKSVCAVFNESFDENFVPKEYLGVSQRLFDSLKREDLI